MVKFEYEIYRDEITTLDRFLKGIKSERSRDNQEASWFFRGDKAVNPLTPHIGRLQKYAGVEYDLEKSERKILHRFKRFAYMELDRNPSDWEALFIARHYAMPTRLLDWTGNPLIALYFACSLRDRDVQPGVVWAIRRTIDDTTDIDIYDPDFKTPLEKYKNNEHAIKLIFPVYNSRRIFAQTGIFTFHSQPKLSIDSQKDIDFDAGKLDIDRLVKFNIILTQEERITLIRELDHLGINQRTLFLDIKGISDSIWQREVLWNGK